MMTSNATHSNILKPVPSLEDMSLTEIVDRYLKTCVKSNGFVSKCIACKDKCVYGKRAEDLAKGLVSPGMSKPVAYEGSMLQMARMQNELERMRKAKTEVQPKPEPEKKTEEKPEASKKPLKRGESFKTWFEDSLKAPDQVAWVMEHFNISRTKAKNKIYQVTYSNDEAREMVKKYRPQGEQNMAEPEPAKEEPVVEVAPVMPVVSDDELLRKAMERKLEMLMNQQESVEADLKKYQEEFERKTQEAHSKITSIKDQIDTICKTMDILKTI